MDPLTLFALANGAVQAIKKGCQLYKDIKGAAGDIKGVLKDLDEQFNNLHKDKPATPEQRRQLVEKKNEVIELNKKGGETDDVYTEIGAKLGEFFDSYQKCKMVLEEEEKHSRNELYTGDASLGKRALERVLMKKKLEQMSIDLRELVVYQSPPELGALWTDVNKMMEELGKQQEVHLRKKLRQEAAEAQRKERFMRALRTDAYLGGLFLFLLLFIGGMMAVIAYDAEQRHPEWKRNNARATLEIIRRQEIARVLEEANTRADTRYKQLQDASASRNNVYNRESDSSSQ
jgi:hypothetical protein